MELKNPLQLRQSRISANGLGLWHETYLRRFPNCCEYCALGRVIKQWCKMKPQVRAMFKSRAYQNLVDMMKLTSNSKFMKSQKGKTVKINAIKRKKDCKKCNKRKKL